MKLLAVLLGVVALASVAPALPGECGADCLINGESLGYDPVVATLQSGSTVRWVSHDTGHISRDGAGLGGQCFNQPFGNEDPSAGVRLDLVSGELRATAGASTTTCGNAVELPDGSALLAYYCTLHPTMRGFLVVS